MLGSGGISTTLRLRLCIDDRFLGEAGVEWGGWSSMWVLERKESSPDITEKVAEKHLSDVFVVRSQPPFKIGLRKP